MGYTHQTVDSKELFLQPLKGAKPRPLELFVWGPEKNEFHFYCDGLRLDEFCTVFEKDLAASQCLLLSYDPALLAPGYWERYTRDAENQLRQSLGGIVTRLEVGERQIWRADRAAREGKLLAADADGPVRLARGRALVVPGSFLIKHARETEQTDLIEWAAFEHLPEEIDPLCARTQADLEAFRPASSRPAILFSSDADGHTRVVFHALKQFRAALNAVLRGWLIALSGEHAASINHRVLDQFAATIDGLGFAASPEGDFIDKGRSFEILGRLGTTRWGVRDPERLEDLGDNNQMLVYYDRTSGIWETIS